MSNSAAVKEHAFNMVDEIQIRYTRKGKWAVQLTAVKDGLLALEETKFPEGKAARYDFANASEQKSFAGALRSALKSWNLGERFKVNLSQDGKVVWLRNR